MATRSKSISISHLRTAVNAALEAASKKYPKVPKPPTEELICRPYWIWGIPVPWPIFENPEHQGYVTAFTESLSNNPAVAGLAFEGGKVAAATYVSGGQGIIGVQGGAAALTD